MHVSVVFRKLLRLCTRISVYYARTLPFLRARKGATQPLPPLPATRKKMETTNSRHDSGLSVSPTLEEDSLSYCLQLQGGILEPANHLNPAVLEPRSAVPVDSLSAQVQGFKQQLEYDDGYEMSPEWTAFSRSASPPVLSDIRTPRTADSGFHSRMGLVRPLESASSNAGYCSVKGNIADKYRLSFVEVSDNSSDEQELSSSNGCWEKTAALVVQSKARENVLFRESNLLQSAKVTEKLEPANAGQGADLQYDNEEVFQSYASCNLPPEPSSSNQHSLPNYSTLADSERKDKGRNKPVSVNARSTGTRVKSIDHASFSPLYTMSIPSLKHTVQLLGSKLHGITMAIN